MIEARIGARIEALDAAIVECRACPRLVDWCQQVAVAKRAAYAGDDYWGAPVPGFGSSRPDVLVVGLAPGAHGANRTGRMFTGDRSGDWLFASLHRVGLAKLPTSTARGDGQALDGVRITAAVHCAPPGNKPSTEEQATCAQWLDQELQILLPRLKVVVALGGIAWRATLGAMQRVGCQLPSPRPAFGHGVEAVVGGPAGALTLIGSYHPSQQNTFTGRLTEPMLDSVFGRACQLASDGPAFS